MLISPVTTLLCSPHYRTHTASLASILQDEDVLHLTLTGLVGGLQHADVDDRIRKDVSELNETIEEVQAQFRRISVDVFDHAWFTDRRMLVLRPEWEQLMNRFDNFVCHSRRTAQSAAEFLRSYKSTMLDNVDVEDIPRLKIEIKSLLPKVASMKAEADANRDSISSIGIDLGSFRAKFESYVNQAENSIRDIEDIERRIHLLRAEIEELENQIQALYAAIVQAESNTSTAGLFGLLFLSPAAAAFAFGFTLDAVNRKREVEELTRLRSEKSSDLKYWDARLSELLQKQETVRKYRAPMSTIDKDMQALTPKLEVISKIWAYIESDVSRFETELDLASKTSRPAGFKKALEVASESYKKLVSILELYAAEERGGSGGEGPNGGSRTRWRTLDGYDIAW
ncbi:hypothetical protein C8Q74DRAFT_1243296 [Fomes fomentarius]|nr:hypothetical protein C8Q74DRAFT_1243296 [Fomes fomentarius]